MYSLWGMLGCKIIQILARIYAFVCFIFQSVSAGSQLWEDSVEEIAEGDVEDSDQHHRESGCPAPNEWCFGKPASGSFFT